MHHRQRDPGVSTCHIHHDSFSIRQGLQLMANATTAALSYDATTQTRDIRYMFAIILSFFLSPEPGYVLEDPLRASSTALPSHPRPLWIDTRSGVSPCCTRTRAGTAGTAVADRGRAASILASIRGGRPRRNKAERRIPTLEARDKRANNRILYSPLSRLSQLA